MGGDENRDAMSTRKIDQELPKIIARERIDARGRLVENEHLRLVHDRDCKREPLANAERKLGSLLVEIIFKAKIRDQLGKAGGGLVRRQVEKPRMQLEVLPDGQLGVERQRLRPVADAPARIDVAGIERLAEQQCLPLARRQEACQHLHGRGLAAAIRADETENLAAFNGEAHPIDGSEVTEPARERARRDHRFAAAAPWRHFEPIAAVADGLRLQERNERIFDRPRMHLRLQRRRRAGREKSFRYS